MIDVKRKIHIDLVALYDLAYQNDLPEICGALSHAEHLVWELRRREADDQSYFENLQACLDQQREVPA